ncbi:MAG TPA: hypothetical protein VIM64_07865 [Puia sp.]
MKRTKLLTGLMFMGASLFFIVTGCKKSNDGGGGNSISSTVSGTAWQSQIASGVKMGGYTELTGIYGKSGDTSMIMIEIHDSVKVNEPDDLSITSLSFTRKNTQTTYSGGFFGAYNSHGTVLVTSWDTAAHKIAGTFSGVLYNNDYSDDSLKIDNGHFSTSYTVY